MPQSGPVLASEQEYFPFGLTQGCPQPCLGGQGGSQVPSVWAEKGEDRVSAFGDLLICRSTVEDPRLY